MTIRASALLVLTLAFAAPAAAQRLPTTVAPEHYDLTFVVDLARARFDGTEAIRVQVAEPTRAVVLNALDIAFHTVTIGSGPAAQKASVSLDAKNETVTLTVPEPIARGAAEIRVTYSGQLNDKLRGFYLSKGKTRSYAVTQFESTDARRAFPCFDEPAFKATFGITLVINRGDTAISNGKLLSDTAGPKPVQHTLKFATTAKMSSYLVAMAVGDFKCVEGQQDGVPIRICATPDKRELGRIALESAEQVLKFYDGYFAVKYPYGKLDVVAVPDFAAGAMENTAAIFYRETDLLADSRTASVGTRKNIASVIAHEMAHQWFGDLVTMQWWDDLWLNEGFATWMANHPLAAWKPEWNIPVDEGLEDQTALSVDSLKSTRAIRTKVETPAQIEAAFDAIAYQKGAAILRMIESYVGADTFRQGVNAYLETHAYGNASSSDFWSAIAAASGKPIDRIMPTFIDQPGVPLITVALTCTEGRSTLGLSQQRFLLDAPRPARGSDERWQVPICVKAAGHSDAPCEVLEAAERSVTLAGRCLPWVFVNAGAHGYYRTEYPSDVLRAIARDIENTLTAAERLSLAGDEWALVRAGRHNVAGYLTLVSALARESSAGVLEMVVDRLGILHEYVTTDATRAPFEAFVRALLRPALDQLGFAAKPDDPDPSRQLRAVLVGTLGTTGGDAGVIAQSRAALDAALNGGAPLDPTLAGPIIEVAAEHGDARLYDALLAAAAKATSPEEHYRHLYATTDFHDPALIERSLQFAISPQLRAQDTAIYLAQLLGNPAARARTWAFIKEHWAALEPKITIAEGDGTLAGSLSAFCDADARDDMTAFFAAHKLPVASRTLDQTIERINNCIALRERQTPALADWLKSR